VGVREVITGAEITSNWSEFVNWLPIWTATCAGPSGIPAGTAVETEFPCRVPLVWTPLNVTVTGPDGRFWPVTVTRVPGVPALGTRLVISGPLKTKGTPLLLAKMLLTTMGPLV